MWFILWPVLYIVWQYTVVYRCGLCLWDIPVLGKVKWIPSVFSNTLIEVTKSNYSLCLLCQKLPLLLKFWDIDLLNIIFGSVNYIYCHVQHFHNRYIMHWTWIFLRLNLSMFSLAVLFLRLRWALSVIYLILFHYLKSVLLFFTCKENECARRRAI